MSACTPLAAEVVLNHRTVDSDGRTATYVVADGEPVLAGHYHGFPIFPGVCLVECVHRAAVLCAPEDAGPVVLASMESIRLLAPVFPGDTVTITLDWHGEGTSWWCTGSVTTARSHAAVVRLRYHVGGSR